MAVLLGRLRSIHSVLLMTVRQSGSSYGFGACPVAVCARFPANFMTFGNHQTRRNTGGDTKPEVDYSRLVHVCREEGKMVPYNAVWLRENCRCETCFNPATWQRVVVYHQLPPEAFVANHVSRESKEGVVEVTWGDGHLSR